MDDHWKPGDVIVFRGITVQKIWYALPVFVVQDSAAMIALYWPAGTRGKWRMKPSGEKVTPRDILQTPMELIDRTWDKTDVLMLITPGAAHAVYLMWEEGQKNLLRWYVNLQDPIRRTPIGFDRLKPAASPADLSFGERRVSRQASAGKWENRLDLPKQTFYH